MRRLTKFLAKTVAATVIAVFWGISSLGMLGSTVGVTALTAAVTAAISTPAEAGRRWRGRRRWAGRRWRGRGYYGGWPYYRRPYYGYGYPYYYNRPRFGLWFGF
jgi:hypothetical protein